VRGALNVPKAAYLERTNRYGKPRLSPSDLVFGGLAKLQEKDAEQFLDWVNGFPSRALQIYPSRSVYDPRKLVLGEIKVALPLIARLYGYLLSLSSPATRSPNSSASQTGSNRNSSKGNSKTLKQPSRTSKKRSGYPCG
jgi:hypothetical protein